VKVGRKFCPEKLRFSAEKSSHGISETRTIRKMTKKVPPKFVAVVRR
jgi:hypothetical protein